MLCKTMNTPVTYHPYLQRKESITVVVSSENIIFNPRFWCQWWSGASKFRRSYDITRKGLLQRRDLVHSSWNSHVSSSTMVSAMHSSPGYISCAPAATLIAPGRLLQKRLKRKIHLYYFENTWNVFRLKEEKKKQNNKNQNNQSPSCAEISINHSFLITCELNTQARKKTQHHLKNCDSYTPQYISPKKPAMLVASNLDYHFHNW